jgi:hypothetical protein
MRLRERQLRLSLAIVLCAALGSAPAWAQHQGRPGGGSPLIGPRDETGPRQVDPVAQDAVDLFSRLCVSTQGDRAKAIQIVGEGDSAIEPMDDRLLRGLENGQPGGVGWIIHMPLGDSILLDFPASGGCIVRAPRVEAAQIETAFRGLLDQYDASDRFAVKREGEQTKTIEPDTPSVTPKAAEDSRRGQTDKLKYHFTAYSMSLPDSGRNAALILATTGSRSVSFQATLSYELRPEKG